MVTKVRQTSRCACAVACILLLFSGSALADWKRDYDRGRKAYADGDWAEAEARFRDAIRDEDDASHRKRFEGMRFDEYMPHFYAGMAAYRQGRCEEALNYWSNTGMQNVFRGELPELRAQWQRGKQECDTRLAAASQPVAPATTTGSSSTPTTGSSTASTAAATPGSGSSSSGSTSPVSSGSTASNTPRPATTTTPPAPRPPDPRPAAVSVPAVLRQAADLYFAGRYQDLLKLEAQSVSDGRARAHALMLRAAAGFSLAEQNGDQRGLDQARQDVRAARSAQASLAPDRAAFSPKFIAFWSNTR
ncbi:hypothetical protein [Pseudomarimonas arenosa]|uniref:Tetratricopeptide repeat protein n=1 Tax=Pseudomarimonas arenosa TaxID=2774145 RepID=A0AAW3ZJ87_9GAMM|nr:hypothetical protein [Pseudomarimonas arenosa]MBD8526140.1 hypothetical protein [Pseudomarimonas arenosa]